MQKDVTDLSAPFPCLAEAKALALKLTLLSDIAFAGLTERTMAIAPYTMERLLTELCRFIIDAAEAAREIAPCRTPENAAYELACANAAIDTLRHAISMRNREPAREPLQVVALRLGVVLEEIDPDWQRLAYRALRVMIEAQEENLSREHGNYALPTQYMALAAQPFPQIQRQMAAPFQSPAPVVAPSALPSQPSFDIKHKLDPAPVHSQIKSNLVQPHPPTAPTCDMQNLQQSTKPGRTINETVANYILLRSQGFSTFKRTEQPNVESGKSWAKNSAPMSSPPGDC